MSKKVLVIKGSCRRDSFTNKILQDAFENIENIEIDIFDAFSESFAFCNGCNYCENAGRCVHKDLDDFFLKFEDADLVVFSSPVFNGGFSAPVKALIDRFQVYYTGYFAKGRVQQIEKHRDAILITAAGQSGEEATAYMSAQLSCAFTILNMRLKRSILCSYTDTEPCYEQALEELRRSLSDE